MQDRGVEGCAKRLHLIGHLLNALFQRQTPARRGPRGRTRIEQYSGSGLTGETEATMPPQSGLVLRGKGKSKAPARRGLTVLATVEGPTRVALRWTEFPGARRYRVRRNGRVVGVTSGRRFTARSPRPGRRYRYSVSALTGRRASPRASRPLTVRMPRRRLPVHATGRHGLALRAALAMPKARLWSRAYVERRLPARGRSAWSRISVVRPPRRSVRFRLELASRSVVRLVVAPDRGEPLRSAPFRLG